MYPTCSRGVSGGGGITVSEMYEIEVRGLDTPDTSIYTGYTSKKILGTPLDIPQIHTGYTPDKPWIHPGPGENRALQKTKVGRRPPALCRR